MQPHAFYESTHCCSFVDRNLTSAGIGQLVRTNKQYWAAAAAAGGGDETCVFVYDTI